MEPKYYDPIAAALKEDIGEGDVTTDFFVPVTLRVTGRIVARENAVVAGTGAAAEVFRQVDPSTDTQIICHDGDNIAAGDVIVEVRGLALRGEDRRDEMRITAKRKIISPSEADGFSAKNDINVKPMKPNRKRTSGRFIFNGCPAFIAVRFRLQGNGCRI